MNTNTLSAETETRTATSAYSESVADNFNSPKLGLLKAELVRKLSSEFSDLDSLLVNQAVNEAQALAALTVVPQLVLPVLAEEKVQSLRKWSDRQRMLLRRRALSFAA